MLHVPTIGDTDRYFTEHADVRAWLTNVFVALSQLDASAAPVMIHCTMGKDRTGVVVCFILAVALGIPLDICREEALLSSDVNGDDFDQALRPLHALDQAGKSRREYFRKRSAEICWDRLVAWLKGPSAPSAATANAAAAPVCSANYLAHDAGVVTAAPGECQMAAASERQESALQSCA